MLSSGGRVFWRPGEVTAITPVVFRRELLIYNMCPILPEQ